MDVARMASTDNGICMIIDSGPTITVVPHFIRESLQHPYEDL